MRRALLAGVLAAGLSAAPAGAADLTTFGYTNTRQGSTIEHVLTAANAGRLRQSWRTRVPGAVNTQALVVHHVLVRGHRRDLVLVGDERGWVTALDARHGGVVWRHRLGTRSAGAGCPAGPDEHLGVTGTLVADPARRRVYAVDAQGEAWALRLASGRTVAHWPVQIHPRGPDFVWSALTLSRGRLYVPVASLCDRGHYEGGVTSVDTATRVRRVWHTTGTSGSYAGGIWGWGGASADAAGDVFVATGNSLGSPSETDGAAEQVVRLDANLDVLAANDPLAPPFAVGDRDFGSTPTLIDAPGCPPQLVALDKDGELFLYGRDAIAQGPQQRIAVADPVGVPLYGDAAYDPATRTLVLTSPSAPHDSDLRAGIQAFTLTADCRLALKWQRPWVSPAGSAPTIAGGVVYLASGPTSFLRGYRLRDGHLLWSRKLSPKGATATPAVVDGRVYESDWGGAVWSFRAPGR